MTGPERRAHDAERVEPYGGRPAAAPAAVAPPTGLDAATQAAIQAAAAAAAAAAIQAQQARALQQPRPGAGMPGAAVAGVPGGPAAMPGLPGFVKVSGQSDPRKVAGKLAHTCRENPAPAMLTIGSNCINQAVKAICIARGACPALLTSAPRDACLGPLSASCVYVYVCSSWHA